MFKLNIVPKHQYLASSIKMVLDWLHFAPLNAILNCKCTRELWAFKAQHCVQSALRLTKSGWIK